LFRGKNSVKIDSAFPAFGFRHSESNFMTAVLPSPAQASPEEIERFARLASEWKRLSRFMSNPAQMAMLSPYQRIIGMGMPATSLILNELRRESDHWFWALEAITDEDPVSPECRGNIKAMRQAWLDWGLRNGFLQP
jgi:hypothetical protein